MKYVFIILFSLIDTNLLAQNVGIGTSNPAASAALEVSSTSKGLLPPRMDSNARNAIVSPVAGLIIYNINVNAFQCYNGTSWYSTVHFIGESYGGGIVFYVFDNGQHGLISAIADQSNSSYWFFGGTSSTNAVRDGLEAGKINTQTITNFYNTGLYAAQLCANYQGGNYGDWYMPSKYELNLLYLNKGVVPLISSSYYWSSTESSNNSAFEQNMGTGGLFSISKSTSNSVRAIRFF